MNMGLSMIPFSRRFNSLPITCSYAAINSAWGELHGMVLNSYVFSKCNYSGCSVMKAGDLPEKSNRSASDAVTPFFLHVEM